MVVTTPVFAGGPAVSRYTWNKEEEDEASRRSISAVPGNDIFKRLRLRGPRANVTGFCLTSLSVARGEATPYHR